MSICRCASSRDELTDSHSPIAIEQAPAARPARPVKQDRLLGGVRPGDTHHEAEIRDEPVIRAKHGGAQRVPAKRAMAAFQSCESAARQPARRHGLDRAHDPGVRPLGGRKPVRDRFGLIVVLADIALFERIDRRQDQLRPEAARQPSQSPRPPA